ncbi:protein-glutamine gamma-glutamyltransferase 2 [Menidia menidia]
MDICFEVLDNSRAGLQTPELDLGLRWDPVYVSRTIAAMVNANGGRGVLAGRWAPPYSDGTAPGSWTGSVPILQSWSRAGHTAVRYGQCWVFAAVGCTVLRCLGVPTRLVTNFSSAHDVDGNLAVDVLEDFESPGRRDSRWNFHCWLEVWMRRDDLPTGNDGWQVLDPTPQERSDGEFCCGPCPVAALREGDLGLRYDAAFVFAEVNADIVYWTLRDGRRQKIRVEQSAVGRNISTKSPHSDSREDLTLLYKYPEGSEKEREVYRRAGRRLGGAPGESRAPGAPGESRAPGESAGPGGLQLSVKHNSPLFGTDFDVMVQVLNEGGEDARVQLTLLATAVTHSCVHQGELHRQRLTLSVPAHGAHRQALRLYYQDYGRCAGEHHLIRVKALLEAGGGAEPVMAVSDIPLKRPELLVQVPGKAFVRQQATAYISFSNPLPEPLRGGRFTAEGAGLLSATQIHVDGDVSPGQRLAVRLAFAPSRAGVRRLLVDFDSDRLRDVKGVATVVVRKSSAAPPAVVGGHVS